MQQADIIIIIQQTGASSLMSGIAIPVEVLCMSDDNVISEKAKNEIEDLREEVSKSLKKLVRDVDDPLPEE